MSIQKTLPNYDALDKLLQQHSIALTAAEIHGLITGLICGGSRDQGWQALVHDLANDGLAFPQAVAQPLRELFDTTFEALDDTEFNFAMLSPDENASIFDHADALAGWVNHFLLGIGVTQPKLADKKEITEVITDLRNIGMLGYDEDEDQEELEQALEEVIEYVRVAVQLCYIALVEPKNGPTAVEVTKPILH
ncbi:MULTISPECIES: YecA/YgfB family protein [unclassified Providencia]|uniref:YecA/YgfB family protein n=1 Tax=unclassified Providencia TaxID=2633465 RepID=UPI000E94992A|nr:YecA family protein [Providencia sp.]MBP6081586.1 YecA family protein [Providencia sp.]HBO21574.1 YecA family protein [Providencia sp.]